MSSVPDPFTGERPLRILFYGLNFAPELTGIGRFSGDLAFWLAERGHTVRAITAPPYYPDWRVAEGYRRPFWKRERMNGVDVLRCPLYVPRRGSGVRRMIHLSSFALTSGAPAVWRSVWWRPDAVLTVEPTATVLPAAWLAARLAGATAWLHIQDFEFDAALDLGLLPPILKRPAIAIERFLLKRFDIVSSISPNMVERLKDKGVAPDRTVLFPNWVDTRKITPEADPVAFRDAVGAANGDLIALYSGNIGQKQGIELLISTAIAVEQARKPGDPVIRIVIAGVGAGRDALEAAIGAADSEVNSIVLLPLQPEERLAGMLAGADMHLLPQRAEAADLVMPSKVGGMLASGRPIVAAAAPDTHIARVITNRGLVVPPSNAAAMAEAILTIARDEALRARFGSEARAAATTEWDRDVVLRRFESELVRQSLPGLSQSSCA